MRRLYHARLRQLVLPDVSRLRGLRRALVSLLIGCRLTPRYDVSRTMLCAVDVQSNVAGEADDHPLT